MAEKLRLQIHLFLCRNCSEYNRRNQELSVLFKKANLKTCSSEEKAAFKRRMEEAQSKGSKNQ